MPDIRRSTVNSECYTFSACRLHLAGLVRVQAGYIHFGHKQLYVTQLSVIATCMCRPGSHRS